MGEHIEETLGREIADIMRGLVAPLQKRIECLEAKNMRMEAALEQRNFAYVGAWKEGKTYDPGMFATYSGSLWHCNQPSTTARPGDTAAWTLAVRSGGK